jgi:hypothetical protein
MKLFKSLYAHYFFLLMSTWAIEKHYLLFETKCYKNSVLTLQIYGIGKKFVEKWIVK